MEDYQTILERLLGRVDPKLDKRESSAIYPPLSAAALEFVKIYSLIDSIDKETHADTANYINLSRIAKERGVYPDRATYSIIRGHFNIEPSFGTRFSVENMAINFYVSDFIEKTDSGEYAYKLVCESSGEIGNIAINDKVRLIPIQDVPGLETAYATQILSYARDIETVEEFRTKYFDSMRNQRYGGNKADYHQMIADIELGVGGCIVLRAWNGPNTVKLIIWTADLTAPDADFVAGVQNAIDPTEHSGEGVGLAPIDHFVTVEAIKYDDINVTGPTTLVFEPGYEDTDFKISDVVKPYFDELKEAWAAANGEQNMIVRVSQIEARILDLPHVLDVGGVKVNGSDTYYIVAENKIPRLAGETQ